MICKKSLLTVMSQLAPIDVISLGLNPFDSEHTKEAAAASKLQQDGKLPTQAQAAQECVTIKNKSNKDWKGSRKIKRQKKSHSVVLYAVTSVTIYRALLCFIDSICSPASAATASVQRCANA